MSVYKVFINSVQEKNEFSFDYQYRNKSVHIEISPDSALVSLERTTDYKPEEIAMGTNIVFSDAIKKAILIHVLIYSKSLNVNTIEIYKNSNAYNYSLKDKNMAQVFSLVNGDLNTPFSDEWKKQDFIETILNQKKDEYDSRMSALFAVICAKNKIYEIERFVNFWISFNGMYGFFSCLRVPRTNQEAEQLKRFIIHLREGHYKLSRNLSNGIANRVTNLLENYPVDEIDYNWLNNDLNQQFNIELLTIVREEITNKIEQLENERASLTDQGKINNTNKRIRELNEFLNYDNTAYAYLLVEYAYYFRCKYIHASEVLPLLSYGNEHEIKCIALVNRLLEDYISNNLYRWFSNDYIENVLKPLANE